MRHANPRCKQLKERKHRNVNDQEERLRRWLGWGGVVSNMKTDERHKGGLDNCPLGMAT